MDQLTPRAFDEIYSRVIEYVDFLIDKVNPRKLLFIAVDGVVPRAKVNQSR
jgi:5'-3' exonuclease